MNWLVIIWNKYKTSVMYFQIFLYTNAMFMSCYAYSDVVVKFKLKKKRIQKYFQELFSRKKSMGPSRIDLSWTGSPGVKTGLIEGQSGLIGYILSSYDINQGRMGLFRVKKWFIQVQFGLNVCILDSNVINTG